ncbi:MAG: hypothetical protein IPL31_02675 [Saprospiraceae bacterium]|nr:hypothetical protein [Saprospiraceae bacterium]MBK8483272.1 hypothetical protein [Saprospiraceae bacterium]
MKTIYLLFFVFFSQLLQSQNQDLNIYYNVFKDSLWYMKNNKPIDEPIVKKGHQVYFHLVEFNNYIYRAEIKATHSTAPFGGAAPNNSVVKGLLSGLVSGILPGIGLPLLNSPIFGNLLGAMPEEDALNASRGSNDELVEFEEKLKELESAREEINLVSSEINSRKKSLASLNNSLEFTNSLSKNPSISPGLIKELLINHCCEVFLKPANAEIILDDVSILNSKLMEIPLLEKSLKSKILTYQGNLKSLQKQRVRLQETDHGIDALYPLIKKLEAAESQISTSVADFSNTLENQTAADSQIENKDYTSKIQQYYLKYHEIRENTFSYSHHTGVEQKFLIYELDLYKIDSLQLDNSQAQRVKHIEVKVKTYGGAAFGVSVGITGSKFTKTPQNYFVRNVNGFSKIYSNDADPYVPMISALFSLSYDLRTVITPSLSLGIGIPFSKNESVENFAIFAGPGCYIGKKQSFMLSTGIMFSKVKVLASGFNVGDEIIIGEGDIPTDKKYSFGYFVGLTYNIAAK